MKAAGYISGDTVLSFIPN